MSTKNILFGILFIIFNTFVSAKVTQVNYKATFGVFGTVGVIKNKLSQDGNTYLIETIVELKGMANMIMGGQKEYYISRGHIQNGLMISDFYEMTSIKKSKKKVRTYTINHKEKYISKRYRKWKKGKLVKDKTTKLDFYAKDDLLTLYFNMNKAIKEKGRKYKFMVIGLEKQNGKVQITVPSISDEASYRKDLGPSADWYAKALIVQENFRKGTGDILLSVSKDGFIKKAVIKDIMMYGDAKLLRVK